MIQNRLVNKLRAPNDAAAVNSRIQEGNQQFVQRETVYGQAYNTHKFLQENILLYHARIDPTRLMSTRYNNNLERVRNLNSYPIKTAQNQAVNNNQEKPNDVLVSPVLRPTQNEEIYKTKHITEHTNGYSRRPTVRVYNSPFKSDKNANANRPSESLLSRSQTMFVEPIPVVPPQLTRSFKSSLRLPGPEVVARLVEPKIEKPTIYQRSYKDISYHETIPQTQHSMKGDNRCAVRTAANAPKDTNLLDLQDRWSKTQALQQYHSEHPESVPYVGDCTLRAKKEILIADTIAKRARMIVR